MCHSKFDRDILIVYTDFNFCFALVEADYVRSEKKVLPYFWNKKLMPNNPTNWLNKKL